jgi:hypothetical protein
MADVRFVPKSATKVAGALALVGALAGAGTLFVWGCTDNSGNGKFVEPNRPFPDAAADAARPSGDAATDGHAASDAADHGDGHADRASSDLGADR